MNREPRHVYLVVRRTWNAGDDQGFANDEERVPVRAFADRVEAEAHCCALEEEARREFDFIALWHGEMSVYVREFREALSLLGLPGLEANMEMTDWFDIYGPMLTAEHRHALYESIPRCWIYEVIESALVD